MSFDIKEIRNQTNRDLAWLLTAPSLLNPSYQHPHQLSNPLTHEQTQVLLEALADATKTSFESTSRRLGHYAEDLIIHWLKHIENKSMHAGIQINDDDKRSIGEFDILFENNQKWHWWELSTKFYCLHQDESELGQWIGPNSQDNFGRKYDHLFNQQLHLIEHPAAQAFLEQQHIKQCERAAFFKGYLFKQTNQTISNLHPAINPDTHFYWYTFIDALDEIPQQQSSSRYIRVPRMQWISPVVLEPRTEGLMSHKHLLNELRDKPPEGPRLFVELAPDSDGWWCECNRGFVMPINWPNMGDN